MRACALVGFVVMAAVAPASAQTVPDQQNVPAMALKPPLPGAAGARDREFTRGHVMPRPLVGPRYWVRDWWGYGLPQPGPGLYWVRHYEDALLVDPHGGVHDERSVDWGRYDHEAAARMQTVTVASGATVTVPAGVTTRIIIEPRPATTTTTTYYEDVPRRRR